MRFDQVSPGTVRFWAWLDSSVSWTLALPFVAPGFLRLLYRINGWMGGVDTPPPFGSIQLFFVCLSGVLIALWVLVRLLHPVGVLAFADALGRIAVALLIGWFLLATRCAAGAGAVHRHRAGGRGGAAAGGVAAGAALKQGRLRRSRPRRSAALLT